MFLLNIINHTYTHYQVYLRNNQKELFNLFGINLVDSIVTDYIKINECTGITFFLDKGFDIETHLDKLLDWLNKNHFDYRGLIEKELALDASNLGIYGNK